MTLIILLQYPSDYPFYLYLILMLRKIANKKRKNSNINLFSFALFYLFYIININYISDLIKQILDFSSLFLKT